MEENTRPWMWLENRGKLMKSDHRKGILEERSEQRTMNQVESYEKESKS